MADRILLQDRRLLRRPHTHLEEVDVSRIRRLAMPIDAIRRTAKDAIESTATAATPTRRLRPHRAEEEEEGAMADTSRTSRRRRLRLRRTATTTADDRTDPPKCNSSAPFPQIGLRSCFAE